jgi:hypothetical protein
MNNEEKIKNVSNILLNLLNENIGNKISPALAEGILNIFYRNLKIIIEDKDSTQEIK